MTARYLAVKALVRQEQNGFANLVLDAELKKCTPPLEARDAAFAARVFYTVLEHQNLLDYKLAQFCKVPLRKLDAPVRAVLRAGLAQASYMQVPQAAAVNEAVKLAKAFGKTSAAGMVNAVLRRATALSIAPEQFPDPVERLHIYYSLSEPIARLLYAQYGAEALALAAAFESETPTYIRINPLRTEETSLTKSLEQDGCTVSPGPWAGCLAVQFPGGPAGTAAFRQGAFHVQGLASQYAALCVGAQPGQRVLDLCAAPGGKSLTMAQQMQNKGELLSAELAPNRVPLLEKAFARCGVTCARAICSDASVFEPERGTFDRVLCDVPCTGLGVIGKKPDIRYKDLAGVENLYGVQQKILQNGARYLAQNGRLVYSTCTVNRSENEEQVKAFLAANPDFRLVPPQFALQGAQNTPNGTLLLPQYAGTDGFFVAVLEKRK